MAKEAVKPKFTTFIRKANGNEVLFDTMPEEDKKRMAESMNRKAIEAAAGFEGLKVEFIAKGTA